MTPVSVAFRRVRTASGAAVSNDVGNLVFGVVRSSDRVPYTIWTDALNASSAPWSGDLEFNEQWAWLVRNWVTRSFQATNGAVTNVALYEDFFTGGMFGLRVGVGINSTVSFLPFADGVIDANLAIRSDFTVMEDNVCRHLLGDFATEYCGAEDVL